MWPFNKKPKNFTHKSYTKYITSQDAWHLYPPTEDPPMGSTEQRDLRSNIIMSTIAKILNGCCLTADDADLIVSRVHYSTYSQSRKEKMSREGVPRVTRKVIDMLQGSSISAADASWIKNQVDRAQSAGYTPDPTCTPPRCSKCFRMSDTDPCEFCAHWYCGICSRMCPRTETICSTCKCSTCKGSGQAKEGRRIYHDGQHGTFCPDNCPDCKGKGYK